LSRAVGRRTRRDPSFRPRAVDDVLLDRLYRDGLVVNAEHARLFAGRGTDSAGELREIVGLVKLIDRVAPAVFVNQIVPLRNNVSQRAAVVAEWNSAIHAAGALLAQILFGEIEINLVP